MPSTNALFSYMRCRQQIFLAFTYVALILSGCSPSSVAGSAAALEHPKTNSAEDFLKWSMDRYKALKSFKAHVTWSASAAGYPSQIELRDISYIAPNVFQTKTSMPAGMKMTAVSDGTDMVEYTEGAMKQAMQYPAPESLAETNSMLTTDSLFCGTPLYKFFGGSDDFDQLVDSSKGNVTFGQEVALPSGAKAKTVKFYAAGPMYGNTQMQIDETNGTVYSITYDSAPVLEQLKTAKLPDQAKQRRIPLSATTTETYSNIVLNPTLSKTDFVVKAPEGTSFLKGESDQSSPVAIGSAVPDFQVIALKDNRTVSLHSLRGKVVLVDIWATWCGPCKMAMPHNEDLYKELKNKGFEVMAISDEDESKIQSFVSQNGYTMPFYRDPEGKVGRQFQVNAIPTTLIVDRNGKLSSYLVGYREESEIRHELAKAGLR